VLGLLVLYKAEKANRSLCYNGPEGAEARKKKLGLL